MYLVSAADGTNVVKVTKQNYVDIHWTNKKRNGI